MYNKYFKHQKGITGLETAIILIAFVVVAAVFAYTALSAGLFSTQKAQEAVYSGLSEARSTIELKGGVIATAETPGAAGTIQSLTFTVTNVLGGEPVDFTVPTGGAGGVATGNAHKVVINYLDQSQEVDNLYWTVDKVGNDDGDALLEAGEKFQITVGAAGNGLVEALNPDLSVNKIFSIIVLTPAGAVLTIERTTPAFIDDIINLR
jgi:archaeal flagellin FlaB